MFYNVIEKCFKLTWIQFSHRIENVLTSRTGPVAPSSDSSSQWPESLSAINLIGFSLHLNITHVPGKQEIHECYMRMYVHESVTTFPYFDTHSVETALLKVLNDILVSTDEGKIVGIISLSAIDTVDHPVLINRLSGVGVGGATLQWFHSYCQVDRNQFKFVIPHPHHPIYCFKIICSMLMGLF